MLLLCTVDALSLVFAVVFLKCRSNINMLQVMKNLTLVIKVASRIVRMTMERNGLEIYFSLSQVYLFQWKEYGLCLASQQVHILAHIITKIT